MLKVTEMYLKSVTSISLTLYETTVEALLKAMAKCKMF